MSMVNITRPNSPDVTVRNAKEFLYVKGDADTDGSIRIIPETTEHLNVELQLRSDGVWNDTGLQVLNASIHIGHELAISGTGQWILISTEEADETFQALVPHIEYNSEDGTLPYAHIPILSPELFDVVFQPDDSGVMAAATFGYQFVTQITAVVSALIVKTSAAATSDVRFSTYRGPDNTGPLFFQKTFPADHFPANSTVRIDVTGLISVQEGAISFHEWDCVTPEGELNPSGVVSLKSDVGETSPWQAYDFYVETEEDLMTSTTGMDRVLIDISGVTVASNDGTLVLDGLAP